MESPAQLLNASCSNCNCREYTVIIETQIVINCKTNKMDEAVFLGFTLQFTDGVSSLQFVDFRVIFAHLQFQLVAYGGQEVDNAAKLLLFVGVSTGHRSAVLQFTSASMIDLIFKQYAKSINSVHQLRPSHLYCISSGIRLTLALKGNDNLSSVILLNCLKSFVYCNDLDDITVTFSYTMVTCI